MTILVCLLQQSISGQPLYDFTGDARTDFVMVSAVSASAPRRWKILRNPGIAGPNNAFIRIFDFGIGSDQITPGDFFGTGKTEVGVWRSGFFYEAPFPEGTGPVGPLTYVNWGTAGDVIGRNGDYDGDGKDDETIIRASGGKIDYWINGSMMGMFKTTFGDSAPAGSTLFAFPGADFNADGRDELVIAQVNNSSQAVTWFFGNSFTGVQLFQGEWGNFTNDYIISPADYTGDGRADLAIWRAGGDGGWYIRNTATGATVPPVVFGRFGDIATADIAARGDYDGDGIHDRAVFRPSTREFFWIPSSAPGTIGGQQWGEAGDTPLATFFVF